MVSVAGFLGRTARVLSIGVILASGLLVGCTGSDGTPSVDSKVTIKSMAEVPVAAGQLIEELGLDFKGQQTVRVVIDPVAHRGFREIFDPTAPLPGFGFTVFDEGGNSEMNATDLEVYPYGGAGFEGFIGIYDRLKGQSVEVMGYETIEGRQAYVVSTTVSVAEGKSTAGVKAYVDVATGLVVREERTGGIQIPRVERRIIPSTPELLQRMDLKAMDKIVEGYRQQRAAMLTSAPFPVYGLPKGYQGLAITSIIPSDAWHMVQIRYGSTISVRTLDPSTDPEYGSQYLKPLEQAWRESDGSTTVLRFSLGGMGIEVQAPADMAKQVAQDLVVVGGPGTH
jgi:hypothetical protein